MHALDSLDLMDADRRSLSRRLASMGNISDPKRRKAAGEKFQQDVSQAEARMRSRRTAAPSVFSYPEELPITERREELLRVIADNQVVIVAGETGSGKSTQLPKLCLELGRGQLGMVGHTQPRRIAARSIAERVATELGSSIGQLVGFTVRFSDQVGDDTLIRVMTDGILLNEIHRDRLLNRYDTIIIDEAHERGLNTDFLLGYLKRILPKRPDIKVIITSATIDTQRFSEHFDGAPVISVSGRTYPVEIRYRPLGDAEADTEDPKDQVDGITDAVRELFAEGDGDVLVFCSGEREIRDAVDALAELRLPHTEILPLYGRLSASEQHRVFSSHTGRRVVVATNVAETSLTVPGIRYVIDTGTARISRYNRRTKVQRLPIEPISQASADQRSGRCGRLGPGIAVRLYSQSDFEERPEFTDPEILRTQLGSVMLKMSSLGLGEIETFGFLDPPDNKAIRDGVALLEELGALREDRKLTKLGHKLATLPVDLRLGRMILEAEANVCLREVLIIASGLSIQDPRERPTGREDQADQSHQRFVDPTSDFVSWLELWSYIRKERRARTGNQFRKMCRQEFLNYRRVREWQDVEQQLREAVKDMGLRLNSQPAPMDAVHLSMMAGLLSHVGSRIPDGYEYRGARGAAFAISPGSALFKRGPAWVMAAELTETTRLWARGVVGVDPKDVAKVANHLVKRTYSDPWWDSSQGAALAHETATLYGLPLYTDLVVQYGRIDTAAARDLFIRHVLVASDWDSHYAFVRHNREIMAQALELESQRRRTDVLVDDDDIVAFFAQRIPNDIVTTRHFNKWWKADPKSHTLDLSLDNLVVADLDDEESFPQMWTFGDSPVVIEYAFEPASPQDGLTFEVPLDALARLDASVFAWLVPGRRRELYDNLIRSLPKQVRKSLAPISETVETLMNRSQEPSGSLRAFLRAELSGIGGIPIPPDAFNLDDLPVHLRPWFRVLDGQTILGEGPDIGVLSHQLASEAREAAASSAHPIEATGLKGWDFGALPEMVLVGASRTYPALVDEVSSVSIRLFATTDEQYEAMWAGVRRLVRLRLPAPHKALRTFLSADAKLAIAVSPYANEIHWAEDCLVAALDMSMLEKGLPWDGVEFDALLTHVRSEVAGSLIAVAQEAVEAVEAFRSLLASLGGTDLADVAADIESHVGRMMYPNFVSGLGADRIPHVTRYLLAADYRLAQAGRNVPRDRELMLQVQELEAEYDRITDLLPHSTGLIDLAWMLQELRVSFFAQSMGTRGSVSIKRIRASLDEIASA